MLSFDIEAIRKIAHYRREFSLLKLSLPVRRRDRMRLSEQMFERSLTVEPDGAGLPCILEAAKEKLIDL